MSSTFMYTDSFNQPLAWDTSKVKYMGTDPQRQGFQQAARLGHDARDEAESSATSCRL